MTALTADQAAAEIQRDDHRRALATLKEEQRKTVAVKERAKKQQARFDKTVAMAISTRPAAEEWPAYPTTITQTEVHRALGMSPADLYALMKRYRKRVSA